MIQNVVLDFGSVLVDWDPHHLFDPYFGSREKADWFLSNICTYEWNVRFDGGASFKEGVEELAARYPEWSKEIHMYHDNWIRMMGGDVEGMYDLLRELKAQGLKLYGLSNWCHETFVLVKDLFGVFKLLDGMVISGFEKVCKPDPRIYHILIERYGLDPARSVFVDDRQANVDGAVAVGMGGILFKDAAQLREELKKWTR